MRDYFASIFSDFHSILIQVTIHPYYENQPYMIYIIPRLYAILWGGWIKIVRRKKTIYHGGHWWFYRKTIPVNCSMALVLVDAMCVLQKTKS